MSNAAYGTDVTPPTIGDAGPFCFALPVSTVAIAKGALVSQLTSGGAAVAFSTASAGVCVGIAQFGVDNTAGSSGDKRIRVETKRMAAFANGTSGDAFAETTLIGSIAYATDDHTVAKTSNSQARQPVGFFYGMESDGRVRVFVDPATAKLASALMSLSALTNSPASADALRDEIVAAVIAAVG